MRRGLATLALLSQVGCALAASHARVGLERARLARARELGAEQRAPTAFERFRAARRAAEQSSEKSGARAERELEARLWLELAIAEAERQTLSERRLAEERALVELDAKIVELERERSGLARENALRAAQAIAREEAERALAQAALRPAQRVKLGREDAKRAAEALLLRAELIALTLDSLAPSGPALTRLRAKLSEAKALCEKEPEASLVRADQALFFALSLLAELRGQAGEPDPLEKATLREALESAGARVTRGDQGLIGTIERAFSQGGLEAEAARTLERLCALAKAHPRGAVRLSVQAESEREAELRTRVVRQRFSKSGCEGERFAVAPVNSQGAALEAAWLAY